MNRVCFCANFPPSPCSEKREAWHGLLPLLRVFFGASHVLCGLEVVEVHRGRSKDKPICQQHRARENAKQGTAGTGDGGSEEGTDTKPNTETEAKKKKQDAHTHPR